MYIEAVLIGVLIGWLRHGRIDYFLNYPFRARYLSLIALLIFALPYILCVFGICDGLAVLPYISMVLCAVVILINHKCLGMKLLFLGLFLNLVIMGLNDFVMPIDTEKLLALGQTAFVDSINGGEILNYGSMYGANGLSLFLGKVISMPAWYIHTVMLSVGDIISCIGIVLVVQNSMIVTKKVDMSPVNITRWG